MKKQLCTAYPCENDLEEASFLAKVLCFGMERSFVKRDASTKKLLATGTLSPIIRDFIFDSNVPKPCRYFCGREEELVTLHELLSKQGKVFLQGIAGIGKSELAKAYAKQYVKDYTNILYVTYTGNLKQDIARMDFVDDLPNDSEEERFRKHNRFLRTLKEDTLLIIDNFNATATQDSLLSVVLKYRCHVLFTTRSRFDNYTFMNLEEISKKEVLLQLMRYFYTDAEQHHSIMEQIIETVHHHTLAVELAARLLETGILEPLFLLNKLKEERASLNSTDTIGITKDGKSRKATYYDHIHTLFSLYQLSSEEWNIMRNLSLIPITGISGRLFAHWMDLSDMNLVNDLVEKGFVQMKIGRIIALHPMIQEVTIDETKPSVKNCHVLLSNLQKICLCHGGDVSYYKLLFQTIESIISQIDNDDVEIYLRFLEDVFPYMEKYSYKPGMEVILNEMARLLKNDAVGTVSDRALLFDYRAACEKNLEKAIKLQKESVSMLTEITQDNARLSANLFSNLGALYKQNGNLQLAKQTMERGIQILEQYGLMECHDSISQIANYAVVLTDVGQGKVGLSMLKKLSYIIKAYNLQGTMDDAMVQEALGGVSLVLGEVQNATTYFKKEMEIYETLFGAEPEVIAAKEKELLEMYVQAGLFCLHR